MTVQELYDALLRRKKTLGDLPDETFYDWADEMNRFAYEIMYVNEPERFMATEQYTVLNGVSSYALPDDLLTFSPFGCGFYIVNSNGDTEGLTLPRTGTGSQQIGYYLEGDNVILTGVDHPQGILRLKYIPIIDSIDSMSDEVVIPRQFKWYAVDALDTAYDVWDEDPYAESMADQRFANKLMEFAKFLRRDSATVSVNTFKYNY